MSEHVVEMNNPVNRKEFRKHIFIAFAILLIGLIYVLLRVQQWNAVAITFVLIGLAVGPLVPFYIGWDGEYLRRPFKVEIREDGVVCYLRYEKKPRFIPWDQVISIGAHPLPDDPYKRTRYYWLQDGTMWFRDEKKRKRKEQYILHRSIALAARENYYERMGRYPPMFYSERTNAVRYA